MQYNYRNIEQKWQAKWKEDQAYRTANDYSKPKCYVLDMFPYPSGAGLHVGHPLGYIASDIYARYKRLKGYNVLHPMGFDAFGLPAEQYAIETGQHPSVTTGKNIARYKEQLDNIGFSFDWSREVKTSDTTYYKWTQWIFLQLYNSWYNAETDKAEPIETVVDKLQITNDKFQNWELKKSSEQEAILMNYRLAYRAESYVNWCEALGTVLANDEVVNGVSERGGHPVERKLMSQWFLRITAFAERLLQGLDQVDFPDSLKEMQKNWIGKSVGAEVIFECAMLKDELNIQHSTVNIPVFTTRPDTIFGVSFLVLAPEHELVDKICTAEQKHAVDEYKKYVSSRSERERLAETKTISGSFTGAYAIHPFTKKEIPIWISEYVLAGYGTGAIMAVPCGDERDHAFAKYFNLPIPNIFKDADVSEKAYTEKTGVIAESDFLNDMPVKDATKAAIDKIEEMKIGVRKINFRMRDAGFSRQRYWGEPFPIVYDANNTPHVLPESELPVELPHLETYSAGPAGKGPLANAEDWVKVETNGGEVYLRETDTMPGYAGSSWYYLRYMDPHNADTFCDKKISDYWNQVDVYVGGAEHAVGHLLYSRMWCKSLYDLGHISFEEPYKKLINQGMIQGNSRLVYRIKNTNTFVSSGLKHHYETDALYAEYNFCDGLELDTNKFKQWREEYATAEFILEEGKYICGGLVEKMSKRLFNVVNPDDIIEQYGTDTFRMYEMFLGPLEVSKPWDTKGIEGVHRFLKKFWRLYVDENNGIKISEEKATNEELKTLHFTIKKVSADIENFAFNTSVSQFMICTSELGKLQCSKREILQPLLIVLNPFAPHISAELWHMMGNESSILDAPFPEAEEKYLIENTFRYPVAVNGKTRTEFELALDVDAKSAEDIIMKDDVVLKWMEEKPLKKFIFVKGKMINVVV